MAGALEEVETPQKWRFTWEAQSLIPTLRLFLFDSRTNPSVHCRNLRVEVSLSRSELLVAWSDVSDVSLRVPIPRVLIDVESPVSFRSLDDHIEVKLVLLLPVGHPIVSSFDWNMNSSGDEESENWDSLKPLSVASDIQRLSCSGGVHLYCRSCELQLTRSSLGNFAEMPSVNWREVADNWFGTCCCSFGGISEKLVARFANSYTCSKGMCLLNFATVTICKDDLVEYDFPNSARGQSCEPEKDLSADNGSCKTMLNSRSNGDCNEKLKFTTLDDEDQEEHSANVDQLSCLRLESDSSACEDLSNGCCTQYVSEKDLIADNGSGKTMLNSRSNCNGKLKFTTLDEDHEEYSANVARGITDNIDRQSCLRLESDSSASEDLSNGCCTHHVSETSQENQKLTERMEILENQRSFLNGFLGNIFMVRSSNLSKDVEWAEFTCPQCSNLLGAYPRANGCAPVDGGVRLFKCCISTSLPTSGSGDLFRDYTLERMFTNQLLDIAKDELSYRTVIRDLETEVPMLQVVVVNTNSWSCTGFCLSKQSSTEAIPKIDLQPVIKVLYTECSSDDESEIRVMEDRIRKGLVDETFMLRPQIKDTIESLLSQRNTLPLSYSSLQGMWLSSMKV